jgi:iron-sulfur cluster repair protein YtfE (RIC family)
MKELYRRLSGLERDMLVHIDLENRVLFPRAIELDADAERMNDQA